MRRWRRHPYVSTRCRPDARTGAALVGSATSQEEAIARVAQAKREVLLRAYWRSLRREDLEDCHAQATLELLAQSRRGHAFLGDAHIANTLELRMVSRIRDLRRALAGRSPIRSALASALPIWHGQPGAPTLVDRRADLEPLVMMRSELRRVVAAASELSADQKLVLVHQIAGGGCAAFCRSHGWSAEKYRKVAQRGRSRLRELVESEEADVPSRGREADQKPGPAYETPRSPTHRPAREQGAGRR